MNDTEDIIEDALPPAPPLPIEHLREQVEAHLLHVLGMPEELSAAVLEEDGSPLLPVAVLLRQLVTRRFRLLDRAGVGAGHLIGHAHTYAAQAAEGRTPWRLGLEAAGTLNNLDGKIGELDEVLPLLAGALIATGNASGLCTRPDRVGGP